MRSITGSRIVTAAVVALFAWGVTPPARAVGTEPGEIVGTVVSVFKTVDVFRKNKKIPGIQAGFKLERNDELRTGLRGRARIEFADRYQDKDSGPSVINVASRSHIKVEDFRINLEDSTKNKGVIELIKGAIRAFAKGWGGQEAAFSVRTGTSLCGIRGSEEVVRYFGNQADGQQGMGSHSCLSGDCFTQPADLFGGGRRQLGDGIQRLMPSGDPKTWKDTKLSQKKAQSLVGETGVPGVSDEESEEKKYGQQGEQRGQLPQGGTLTPGASWMGVRWTPEGLPDCQASVQDLMLNTYRWDEIRDQRDFTFYKDELVNGRFVVSGQVSTQCPGELLQVDVSVDGGASWVQAVFNPQAGTFRYEFDPTGFTELDLRVRPSFQPDLVEKYRASTGLGR